MSTPRKSGGRRSKPRQRTYYVGAEYIDSGDRLLVEDGDEIGSAVDVLIGEVFEAPLGYLIEEKTGIAGLTISPMHTGYALKEGRAIGAASIESVATTVGKEQPDVAAYAAPDGTVTISFANRSAGRCWREQGCAIPRGA